MTPGFQIRALSKHFGATAALTEISFEIPREARLAILGRSGSGKSTLLRLLAGLEAPLGGEILLDGTRVSAEGCVLVPPYKRNIAMVFQDLALWPNLTVLENVLLGASSRKRAVEALALCRIEDLADRRPAKISGGQQQRAALARALARRPEFLFLDEPFSGLDVVTKSDLLADIANLTKKEGIALVLVSHDPWEAAALCESALVLEQGRIAEEGQWHELMQAPRSTILRVFGKLMKTLPT